MSLSFAAMPQAYTYGQVEFDSSELRQARGGKRALRKQSTNLTPPTIQLDFEKIKSTYEISSLGIRARLFVVYSSVDRQSCGTPTLTY